MRTGILRIFKLVNTSLLFRKQFNSAIQYPLISNGSFFFNTTKGSKSFGENELKQLSQLLRDNNQDVGSIIQKAVGIKKQLSEIDSQLVKEYHIKMNEFFVSKRNSSTSIEENNRFNGYALCELIETYFLNEEADNVQDLKKICEELAEAFKLKEGQLPFSFQSPQTQFDILVALSQIFGVHKKDEQSKLALRLIQEQTPSAVKQKNCEQYIESLSERVTLSQFMRDHEGTFVSLDVMFSEIQQLQIPKESKKILIKINQFFLRAILLSTQFEDKNHKESQYQQLQKEFLKKYDYQSSSIEKLSLQVKEISLKTPNYIQVKGETINIFVDKYKMSFSSQIQDVLIYQLYNQVVPLNLFEYYYMLIKFESNYREEIEEVPSLLKGPKEELVDDFEELIVSNISVLLEIRRLITLFTNEVLEIQSENPYDELEISSWIHLLSSTSQKQIKENFKKNEQQFV